MMRNRWHKENNFDNLVKFMLDAIGSPLSSNNITGVLKNDGYKISRHTIDSYLQALTESYLFYKVPRYDIKGKNILRTLEKYYTVDLGFKQALLGKSYKADFGHDLENAVYLELLRRNRQVYVGKADSSEMDFAVMNNAGDWEYIQVAWTAKEESTFLREMRPFERIRDFNRRILLTTDVEPVSTYKGIQKLNVIDWLLKE